MANEPSTDAAAAAETVERPIELRAFLIADVRGYTRFTSEQGNEAATGLAVRFAAVVRAAVADHDGQLLEVRGDEALCVFPLALKALRASVEVQRRLRTGSKDEPPLRLGVGIGVDVGEAVPIDGGYRGAALNVAARLCALAGPGQVLATETAVRLAGGISGVRYLARRAVRLKGLAEPVRVVEVVPETPLPPLPPPPKRTPRARRRRLIAFAAVGAALVAAGVTASLMAAGLLLPDSRDAAAPLRSRTTVGSETSRPETTSVAETGERKSVAPVPLPRRSLPGIAPNSIGMIDPKRNKIVAQVRLGASPTWIIADDESAWAALANKAVARIDPRTRRIVAAIATVDSPYELAFAQGGVWVLGGRGGEVSRLSRIEPLFNDVLLTARIDVGLNRFGGRRARPGLAVGAGSVWVTDPYPPGAVKRVDPSTGKVVGEIVVSDTGVAIGPAITVADGGVWVSVGSATMVRVDPHTDSISTRISVPAPAPTLYLNDRGGPVQLAAGEKGLWLITQPSVRCCPTKAVGTGTLSRIDPKTDTITATIPLKGFPVSLAVGEGAVWVASQDGMLWRIDPRSLRIEAELKLGGPVAGVAVGAGVVWAAVGE